MTAIVILVFGLVYLGMILGGLPFVQLDRTGVALLGPSRWWGGRRDPEAAVQSLHLPTLILLFAFMVLSAQMRLGGFLHLGHPEVGGAAVDPPQLLGGLIVVVAALAAVFSNDVVCLAVTPVLIDACRRRGLDPLPYLLALACAANIGSAATLIGNPQNMLIGATLRLSFSGYALAAAGRCCSACWRPGASSPGRCGDAGQHRRAKRPEASARRDEHQVAFDPGKPPRG